MHIYYILYIYLYSMELELEPNLDFRLRHEVCKLKVQIDVVLAAALLPKLRFSPRHHGTPNQNQIVKQLPPSKPLGLFFHGSTKSLSCSSPHSSSTFSLFLLFFSTLSHHPFGSPFNIETTTTTTANINIHFAAATSLLWRRGRCGFYFSKTRWFVSAH